MKKRFIALLLSLVICVSLIPNCFADDANLGKTIQQIADAYNKLGKEIEDDVTYSLKKDKDGFYYIYCNDIQGFWVDFDTDKNNKVTYLDVKYQTRDTEPDPDVLQILYFASVGLSYAVDTDFDMDEFFSTSFMSVYFGFSTDECQRTKNFNHEIMFLTTGWNGCYHYYISTL